MCRSMRTAKSLKVWMEMIISIYSKVCSPPYRCAVPMDCVCAVHLDLLILSQSLY